MDDNETADLAVNSGGNETAVIEAVVTTNIPLLKQLLERYPDLIDSVEPASGNSLLHLAVLHGGYNAAVHLLNRGCCTLQRNGHGLTAVQLAQRLPERGAFAVAIQLTERKRREQNLAALRRSAAASTDSSIAVPMLRRRAALSGGTFASLQQLTRRNLDVARGTLLRLEAEVCAAKVLIQSLEHQLILLDSAAQLADLEPSVDNDREADTSGRSPGASGLDLELVTCGVCLEIVSSRIYQCRQGHIYCEQCFARPEMTLCPECRISIEEPVRNRALEKIVSSLLSPSKPSG